MSPDHESPTFAMGSRWISRLASFNSSRGLQLSADLVGEKDVRSVVLPGEWRRKAQGALDRESDYSGRYCGLLAESDATARVRSPEVIVVKAEPQLLGALLSLKRRRRYD